MVAPLPLMPSLLAQLVAVGWLHPLLPVCFSAVSPYFAACCVEQGEPSQQ